MNEALQLHEFFVEGGRAEQSHALLHITEPATAAEQERGYFFAVCELEKAERANIINLQELIDELENRYYDEANENPSAPLEAVLEHANHSSWKILSEGAHAHCLIGAVRQSEIFFGFCGRPQALLFYQTKEGGFKTLDLIASNQPAPEEDRSSALFPQIIQGKISAHDNLLITTPHVGEFFNIDRLYKITTTRPARQTAEHLERVLSELKNGLSFGGLVIHLGQTASASDVSKKIRPNQKGESARSLTSLFGTEKKTASILSPSFLPRVDSKFKQFLSSSTSIEPDEQPDQMEPPAPTALTNPSGHRSHRLTPAKTGLAADNPSTLLTVGKFLLFNLILLGKALLFLLIIVGKILLTIGHLLKTLFIITTDWHGNRRAEMENWRRSARAFRDSLASLPLGTKILFGLAVILTAVFIFSIFYLRYTRAQLAINLTCEQNLSIIQTKKDAAESAIIYRENDTALREITAAQTLDRQTVCTSASNKQKQNDLDKSLSLLLDQARQSKNINNAPVVDFVTQNKFTPNKIMQIGNQILAFSDSNATLAAFDLLTKTTKIIPNNFSANGFTLATAPKENDYAALFYNSGKMLRYLPNDNALQNLSVDYPNSQVNITGAVIYNRRLYSLDSANGQIYRHDTIKDGFTRGENWLTNTAMVTSGVDLAIDGDLFVLANDGRVLKFHSGAPQTFSLTGIDPPLTSGAEINTYTDWQYLYILDSTVKRLLVINKDGRLQKQYFSDAWVKPTGLTVDELNGRAYVLDSGKIYPVDLREK